MNPTPDLASTVQALNQRVSALEALVIELTLLALDSNDLNQQARNRLNSKFNDLLQN